MDYLLKQYDKYNVLKYFEEISSIPRGSRYNKKISDFLVEFANQHDLQYIQDEYLNVIIRKPASIGYEEAPTVMIQGHMDMVCEKEPWSEHNFETEKLELFVDGDSIGAKGTTLGGDDGIAIAYALAILADNEIEHPNLEVVITTDEEIGMNGAIGLDTSSLKAKYLLNIDSEDEGILLSSSAGGMTGYAVIPITRVSAEGVIYQFTIDGLKGGHSGIEINENRINANILMGRLLKELSESISFSLIQLEGGLKDNVIPRQSNAIVVVKKAEQSRLHELLLECSARYRKEILVNEPNANIAFQQLEETSVKALDQASFHKLLCMLLYAPNGVQVMSSDMEGLVESSLNLGILNLGEFECTFSYSIRSSLNSYKQYLSSKVKWLTKFLSGNYVIKGEYPAWEYKKDSSLRQLMIDVFVKQYNKQPVIEAIHAGLECGILANKIEGLDIVSFGPNMNNIHTPKERLSISSTIRVYEYLLEVLKAIR